MGKRTSGRRVAGFRRFARILLNLFCEFSDGGIYITSSFKGNIEINPGVKQVLEFVPVCWSCSESRRSRG